jgi:glutamate-1-semialdehyde 2,1-aminomutase
MINRTHLQNLLAAEEAHFVAAHPRSQALFARAQRSLLAGVPMPWMVRWAGPFPVFVAAGKGTHFTDVDGHDYIDFCLGDTGAMTGHAPEATIAAMAAQMQKGLTFMLPGEDAIWVGEELARRFGLPFWQIAMTATDANRFALRLARCITRRPKVLVYNYCYHGTVDEAFIALDETGQSRPTSRRHRPAGQPDGDDEGDRVQRRGRTGGGAGPRATSPACWRNRP